MHKRGGGGGVLRSRVPAKRDIWRNLLGSFVVIAGHLSYGRMVWLSWTRGRHGMQSRRSSLASSSSAIQGREEAMRRVTQEDATTIDSESKCGINVYARSHLNNSCTRISAWQLINKIKFIFTYAELCIDGHGDCWQFLLRSSHHHHQHSLRRWWDSRTNEGHVMVQ